MPGVFWRKGGAYIFVYLAATGVGRAIVLAACKTLADKHCEIVCKSWLALL